MAGIKYDNEKPDFSLISPWALDEVAKVMTYGKRKYAAHNWRLGLTNTRLFSAAMRHGFAWLRGEDVDQETGFNHIAHMACCTLMLLENCQLRPDMDDRWKNEQK